MNFYKRFIGDYNRDTAHLSLSEHGAFALMLGLFYATEKPLPDDLRLLYRLLRAEKADKKRAVHLIAREFWTPAPIDIAGCYEVLKAHTDEQRAAFEAVISNEWYGTGGLINKRALCELADAKIIAAKNRVTAIKREQAKRNLPLKAVA